MKFEYLKHEIKVLVLNAYSNAKHAHELIFADKTNDAAIIGCLSVASSQLYAARAIYVCNENLHRDEFDTFFSRFGTFINEVLTNIRTNHSHQWSDIEFDRMSESYQEVASLLGILTE